MRIIVRGTAAPAYAVPGTMILIEPELELSRAADALNPTAIRE